jgi:hypothetical protein
MIRNFEDVMREIEALRAAVKSPVLIPEYADAAALPSPSKWRRGIVFVKSIDRIAISNGTNWLRSDTGVIL